MSSSFVRSRELVNGIFQQLLNILRLGEHINQPFVLIIVHLISVKVNIVN